MKLIVFGASGRCGGHFVRHAVTRGHTITAIVRSATPYVPLKGVDLIRGDVLDADFVTDVMGGHDGVVSALGMHYRHPWSRHHSPFDFMTRAMQHIIRAMKQKGISRISIISAAGVGDSRRGLNWPLRFMLATSNTGYAYIDLERAEQMLRDSGLDWQAVRPTVLRSRHGTGRVRIADRFHATASIPREDVATFMLREIEASRFSSRTPLITAE